MILELRREAGNAERTFGTLWLDGVKFCETLEPARAALDALEDHPCIAPGRYRVSIRYSLKNKMMVPCLSVPGRSNIEIHPLNTARQTLGCIGVGESRLGDALLHSRDAFNALMPKLAPVLAAQHDVFIDVVEPT